VNRGPYEYSVPGRAEDFWLQDAPPEAGGPAPPDPHPLAGEPAPVGAPGGEA
jgi:hypothetical protein